MGLFVNPNDRSINGISAVGSSAKSNQSSTAKKTASKVERVVAKPEVQESYQTRLMADVRELSRKIQDQWNELEPSDLAELIIDFEGKVELLEGNAPQVEAIRKLAERLHFQFVFPIVLELARKPIPGMPYSFARTINQIAKEILLTQSLEPIEQLNQTQKGETIRFAGKGGVMSPEVLSHAMNKYVDALRHQVSVAEAFFFGRLVQGMEGLLSLPEDVRTKIDQFVWDTAGGGPIDPTEKDSQNLIAAAIIHSLEGRMGMQEE